MLVVAREKNLPTRLARASPLDALVGQIDVVTPQHIHDLCAPALTQERPQLPDDLLDPATSFVPTPCMTPVVLLSWDLADASLADRLGEATYDLLVRHRQPELWANTERDRPFALEQSRGPGKRLRVGHSVLPLRRSCNA